MFVLVWRFGIAVIYEMGMIMFGGLWAFQGSIDPATGPYGAFLAAIPAWQLALFCGAAGLAVRKLMPRLVEE
jgi:hypothetical protein